VRCMTNCFSSWRWRSQGCWWQRIRAPAEAHRWTKCSLDQLVEERHADLLRRGGQHFGRSSAMQPAHS
jgi:hypothetical protein